MNMTPILVALLLGTVSCFSQTCGKGGFWGAVLASENEDYIRNWVSTGPKVGVKVYRQDSAQVARPLHITFVTSFFTVIDDSMSVSVDVKIIRPDGIVLMDEKAYVSLNQTIETNRTFVMMPTILDLLFEASDPKGHYLIVARFNDLSSGSRHLFDTLKVRLK